MNPIQLAVAFTDDSREEVSCIAADLIAFETKFDLSIARLQNEVRFTHLAFLGYAALKRTGKTTEEFDDWAQKVAGVEEIAAKK